MATICVLLDDYFEDVEYTEPAKVFEEAGHELVTVGLKKGAVVKGKKQQTPVTIEHAVGEVTVDQFDALLLPGGYSPDRLRAHEGPVRFVRHFVESRKPVFAICHGPQMLISANVLQGRRITGWKSIVRDIQNAGAEFKDQSVVEDGNIISSRGPDDIPAFIDASLKKLMSR